MMRLPRFRYLAPRTVAEAAEILAGEGPEAMPLAGGTDLLPNMKRRQQVPRVLVSLSDIGELRGVANGSGASLGACLTLSQLVEDERLGQTYPALWQAAAQVATPQLRNMGTLGGNLCLDTRCTYYDQTWEWRRAIDFCMKKDGETCWVAPSSPRCLAVSSTDTAPALIALGASVRLQSSRSVRVVPLDELYQNDGIHYVKRRPDEILSEVQLAPAAGWKSTYWKLRRRGAFDFPVLSVAAAARLRHGHVEEARVVLGAVSSRPQPCTAASEFLRGKPLGDEVILEAAALASKLAKPMDNTDFTLHWRKRVAAEFVCYALRDLRGDDMREVRSRTARHALDSAAAV
jgi:4-hydroxybenzoyl-CoA reductase subunit beta